MKPFFTHSNLYSHFLTRLWLWSVITAVAIAFFALTPDLLAAGDAHGGHGGDEISFPMSLDDYADKDVAGLMNILKGRVAKQPFNLVATIVFLLAILHTFMAPKFLHMSHRFEREHHEKMAKLGRPVRKGRAIEAEGEVSFKAELFHFLGEIEAVFGMWCLPLIAGIFFFYDWGSAVHYVNSVSYIEPIFVVVIMAIAATRPVVQFAESAMAKVANIGKGRVEAWWLSILIIAPLLGSFITEPAAMTIAALLLGKVFYAHEPSNKLKYGTLGLLFVNISTGGSLTHFAAPPVIMVAGKWDWNIAYMFTHFGWKAAVGIVIGTLVYYLFFRKEFAVLNQQCEAKRLVENASGETSVELDRTPVPFGIILVHIGFLAWTVMNLHYPVLVIGGFLFFLAFAQATSHHQSKIELRPAMLVGFFLAGLVTLGGLQQWWIEPVLGNMGSGALFWGATVLTAFNDNAAITFLATLVPSFDPALASGEAAQAMAVKLQHAVVAGALTGGGLTVIANAPNPAGQSILSKYFGGAVSPLNLLLAALVPTFIMAGVFLLLPG